MERHNDPHYEGALSAIRSMKDQSLSPTAIAAVLPPPATLPILLAQDLGVPFLPLFIEEVTVNVNGATYSLGAVSGMDDLDHIDHSLRVRLGLTGDDILQAIQAAKLSAVKAASHSRSAIRLAKRASILLILDSHSSLPRHTVARELLVAHGAYIVLELIL